MTQLYTVAFKLKSITRKLRTFSSLTQLLQRVLQGLTVSPMLFIIYINNIFFGLKEIDI